LKGLLAKSNVHALLLILVATMHGKV